MSDIKPEKHDYLWNRTIELGCVNVFYGDGENGKSLTTAEVAARLSVGELLPGETRGRPPCSAIFVTTEDQKGRTFKPRLMAAGADCSKIVRFSVQLEDGADVAVNLRGHLELLSEAIDGLDNCKLVVIDPATEFYPGVNFHVEHELRPALAPLSKLAEDKGIAVVLIAHTNKSGGNAKDIINGAKTLLNVGRLGWLFIADPEDPATYMMLTTKGNNMKRGQTGWAFSVEGVKGLLGDPDDDDDGTPKIIWNSEPATMTADEALRRHRAQNNSTREPDSLLKIDHTVNWLRSMLESGPKRRATLVPLAEETLGIHFSTLDRAAKKLRVVTNADKLWELPQAATVAA